jgi:predicted exporter
MGFGALMLSHHPGLKSMGLLTIIGLVATFAAAVFFLPALIFIYERIASRIHLAREAEYTVWTVAFDPATRRLTRLLRQLDVEYKMVVLDEIPPREMAGALEELRRRTQGALDVPLLEKNGRIVSASGTELSDVRRLLDAPK